MKIVNTVDQDFFQQNVVNAYKQRKEYQAEKQQRNFEMTQMMYNIIMSSNQITSGKQILIMSLQQDIREEL